MSKKRKIYFPTKEEKYTEREEPARNEKDLILVGFKFRKTRKAFVKQIGLKFRTSNRDNPMFIGRRKLLDLLGKDRFCGLSRGVFREIETKDDLFRELSSGRLKDRFEKFVKKNFVVDELKKMLFKRHPSRKINKLKRDKCIVALIGTLCNNKYVLNSDKRKLEQESMFQVKSEAQWTFLAGVGVSCDVQIHLFGYINPYQFEQHADYYQSTLQLLNGLGTSCGTSFYYQVRRLLKRIVITKQNVERIPLITLQNARMVEIKPKGLLKADYVYIHRNISTKVRCLYMNSSYDKVNFFRWIGNTVYQNLEKCFISNILDKDPKEGQFPMMKDIRLKYFNTRDKVKPLSRFGGIKCLRLAPYAGTMVSPNLQGIFPETLKVLKIELSNGYGTLLKFSDECISRMMNLERLVYSNPESYYEWKTLGVKNNPESYYEWKTLGVKNIWRYIKNVKEIQFNLIKLTDDFKSIKPWGVPEEKHTMFEIGVVLREQRFEKVTVKIKIGIAELEVQWCGIMKRIKNELGLEEVILIESSDRPVWAQRFEELNSLESEIPKHGYDIKCRIGKKKLAFWPKVRKQAKNYYRTIVLEYTTKLNLE